MGIDGIEHLKEGEDPPKIKKQCGKKKAAGWGAMHYCVFEAGHDGDHSWVVTG